jgi:phosphohistidine phosphatase SixA
MADLSNSVPPEWVFIMRHAQASSQEKTAAPYVRPWESTVPDEVLTPHGRAEAREVGRALASVLDDMRRAHRPVQVTHFWHEHTKAAQATAKAFRGAYEQKAYAIKSDYGAGPPSLAPMRDRCCRELSAQVRNPDSWIDDTVKLLAANAPRDAERKDAALIIGHDPGMSLLLTRLLYPKGPKAGRNRDVPGLARAELLGLRWDGVQYRPIWALTPGAVGDIAEITAKIKSKMDTAKVFGGFVTAVLTFVVSQYAMTSPKTTYWAAVRGASLTAFAVAILLYLMTLFWYDRLLMPPRFWGIQIRHRTRDAPTKVPPASLNAQDDLPKVLVRPPSSALWVLYQNMQRTWRLLFVPATYAAAVGIVGFALGRIEPSTITALIIFAAAASVVAITAWWGWRSRPILGVQD